MARRLSLLVAVALAVATLSVGLSGGTAHAAGATARCSGPIVRLQAGPVPRDAGPVARRLDGACLASDRQDAAVAGLLLLVALSIGSVAQLGKS